MIATATIPERRRGVAHRGRDLMRYSDRLREDAAFEVDAAFEGISSKKIRAANVPGAGVTYLSRIRHGHEANPIYRLGMLFRLGRILGIRKSTFQRWIDRAQELLDREYADQEPEPLQEVLGRDQQKDTTDDPLRFAASHGCVESARKLLRAKRKIRAHDAVVIAALEAHLATVEAR